jgi:hypothetical protein
MTKPMPHPLSAWLKTQGLRLYPFALSKGIPWRVLYRHTKGEVRSPDVIAMDRIATATGGAVSVQAQMDWFKKKRTRRERT